MPGRLSGLIALALMLTFTTTARAQGTDTSNAQTRRVAQAEVDRHARAWVVADATARLLGESVVFRDLGLVIMDEEQRFGVAQKERLKRLRAEVDVVAMSATLEPFDFYRDLLGFERPRSSTLCVGSPFPPENRLVLAIDDVDTTWRRRSAHYDRIASWIAKLSRPAGNVLTLFPSYQFLAAVNDRDAVTLLVLTIGCVTGLALFSQLLNWSLQNHHDTVMAALIGLMIGSIRVLWPWPDGLDSTAIGTPSSDLAQTVALAVVALVVVIGLGRISRHRPLAD